MALTNNDLFDPLFLLGFDGFMHSYQNATRTTSDLPVSVVHAGHDPSFGRDRLRALCDMYLAKRA